MDDLNKYLVDGLARTNIYDQIYGKKGPSKPFTIFVKAGSEGEAREYARSSIQKDYGCMATITRVIAVPEGELKSEVVEALSQHDIDWSKPWYKQKLIAIDVETTGLDSTEDRITEIGYAVYNPEEKGFSQPTSLIINEGKEIPQELLDKGLNDITNETLKGRPPFDAVAEKLAKDLSGSILIAQNRGFDYCFLQKAFNRSPVNFTLPPALCTVELYNYIKENIESISLPGRQNLGALSKHFGVSLENAHRAGDDAIACGNVFLKMHREIARSGQKQFMKMSSYDICEWSDLQMWPDDK